MYVANVLHKLILYRLVLKWQKQINMFRPSFPHCSMTICFVCGNAIYERNAVLLYSRNLRSRAGEPYFPFLEYHDPAPGSEPMRKDWSIVSCRVCHAFLTQQWESFEITRTPVSKRLYWLKRPSGCEIRQPVSQIELEEILNEHSKDTGEEHEEFDRNESDDDFSSDHPSHSKKQENFCENFHGISPPPAMQQKCKGVSDTEDGMPSKYTCYSCGEAESQTCIICPVHCKPSYEQMRAGVPFYPNILSTTPAKGAKVICDSITFVCTNCIAQYDQELHEIQQEFIKKNTIKNVAPRIPLPEIVPCFVCGSNVSTKFNDSLVYAAKSGKKNPMFVKLETHKCTWSSVPLTCGFTYVCKSCQKSLEEMLELQEKSSV